MALPTDDKSRKALPIFRGPLMYFPDALLAVAAVCKAGNDQHNPGEPLHWARGKSMEQLDTALRHMMDHGLGTPVDTDGMYHMAKAAWRCLAELQLQIERDRAVAETQTKLDADPLTRGLEASVITCTAPSGVVTHGVGIAKREPQVGDRVRITRNEPGVSTDENIGCVGTLVRVDSDDVPYRVLVDDTDDLWWCCEVEVIA